MVPALAVIAACGGLSGNYGEAMQSAVTGAEGVELCTTAGDPVAATVLRITNPGTHDMELRRVEFSDARPSVPASFVVTIPATETTGIGAMPLDEINQGSPAIVKAWATRSRLPAVVPPGYTGEVVVILEPPSTASAMANYVHQVAFTIAVGGATETARLETLLMAGSEQACDAVRVVLDES